MSTIDGLLQTIEETSRNRKKLGRSLAWEGRAWVSSTKELLYDNNIPRIRMITYRLNAEFRSNFLTYTIHKSWETRQMLLFNEIASYQADIYCLQDVDHYEDFWYKRLTTLGYTSIYKQRTQEKDYHPEGILIAFRLDRFQLAKSISIELNQLSIHDKTLPISFQEKCRTDDIAMIVFLQPYITADLPSGFCIGNIMLDELISNEDVRLYHLRSFIQVLEKENKNFQFPILIGCNTNDIPFSIPYTFMKTSRKPLTASIPNQCSHVKATPISRSTAMVKWHAPPTSIADPTILYYRICWRPGGSSILSFKGQTEVPSGDCIRYVEVVDEITKKKKIKASEELQCIVDRLSAEIPYEFKVCAVNEKGVGPWSEASDPIMLKNPERAPALPALVNFKSMEEVRQDREEYQMQRSDVNVHLAYIADPINSGTQLTPRLIDGSINHLAERNRLLPPTANPRLGWNSKLDGQPTESVVKAMNRDYIIHTSLLRHNAGEFREESLNQFQDGALRSNFTIVNHQYENLHKDEDGIPMTGEDGSTLIFDARIAFNSIGKPSERRYIFNIFRSVYELYGAGGEPIYNSSFPSMKGMQNADTLDHLFYSIGSGLVVYRVLTIPPYLLMKRGENPEESLSKEDLSSTTPFPSMKYQFDYRYNQLIQKFKKGGEGETGGDGGGLMGGNQDRDIVNQLKRSLKEILKKQDELIPVTIETQPSTGVSRGPNPPAESNRKVMVSGVWGGRWVPFTKMNPSRSNYYLPNPIYGSSHMAMGAEFIFDENLMNSKMS